MIGVLKRLGMASLAAPIQVGIVLLAAALVLMRRADQLSSALQVAGLAYLWAVFFNPYAVRYEYFGGVLLLLWGLALALRTSEGREGRLARSALSGVRH